MTRQSTQTSPRIIPLYITDINFTLSSELYVTVYYTFKLGFDYAAELQVPS